MRFATLTIAALLLASGAYAAAPPAVIADPAPDPAFPAAMAPLQIASHGANINAVLYRAAGAGAHPALLLLHGLPGNEQNLDLAQAARRAGWHVLTLHYRGSWGSQGDYSFVHCIEDAAAALAFLRSPEAVQKYRIDSRRIVVAGHSLGGIVAARVAANDAQVAGVFLIDPADIAKVGRSFTDPSAKQRFVEGELRGDMPPLAGTSIAALTEETALAGEQLDLVAAARKLTDRPLVVIGAARGIASDGRAAAEAAIAAGGARVEAATWPTDHSFSDMRIALATRLVDWLDTVPPRAAR